MTKSFEKEFGESSSILICSMNEQMVEEVSYIHMEAFKGSMNTLLGVRYLKNFFKWFLNLEEGVALVVKKKINKKMQVVGYVVGAPLGYGKALNQDLFWIVFKSILVRPWLLFKPQFRSTIKARLVTLFRSPPIQIGKTELPSPVLSLVGLGVLPRQQGEGLGKELLCAFEAQARRLCMRSLVLSVYPENSTARHIYEKCGWFPFEKKDTSEKAITYFRIL